MTRVNLVVSVALLIGVVFSGAVSAHHSVQAQYAPEGREGDSGGRCCKDSNFSTHIRI